MRKTFLLLFFIMTTAIIGQELFIKIEFSEQMNRDSLMKINNYSVFNSMFETVPIKKVGVPVDTDSISIVVVKKLNYKTNFIIRVNNLIDKAGNKIDSTANSAWFYFDGFSFNEQKPKIIIK